MKLVLKLLVSSFFVMSGFAYATDETGETQGDCQSTSEDLRLSASCKVKFYNEGKSVDNTVCVVPMEDETDVLTLDISWFKEITVGNSKVKVVVGKAKDDECAAGKPCRMVVGFDSAGTRGFGYANDVKKVGVGTQTFKVSCEIK